MASTTTNYGFTVPTSSDLVKNGATAISTLGQNIDTFLFRPFSKNAVINGGFDIWQRGTSIAATGAVTIYTADRWGTRFTSGGVTASRQTTSDTTNLPNIQYCIRVQRNSGVTATNTMYLAQSFETVNSIPYAGKTVTMSFYARRGANFSPTGNILNANIYSGTGTDQEIISTGYTGSTIVASNAIALTTTWTRYTITGTVGTNINEIAVYFDASPTGTAGANDYFEITGVQLEVGSQATPFSRNASTIQGELAACQRYYYRATSVDNAYTRFGGANGAGSTTSVLLPFVHPVTMRVKPTAVEYGGTYALSDGNGTASISSVALFQGTSAAQSILDVTCSGATQFRPYIFIANNSTSTYIGVTAEL